jgi:hypothetical protein
LADTDAQGGDAAAQITALQGVDQMAGNAGP